MQTTSDLLTRRIAKILPDKSSLEQLISKKKIKLYQGFDPTFNKLHLGHTIGLRKLMDFARAGHEVIFLFGTGTVLAGDPSERETGRKLITQAEIETNIKDWKRQVEKIVDFDKVTIMQNGDWLTKLTLKDIIWIGSHISAVQLFKRESFTRRIKNGDTVWFHETMYPLLQGYDSVVMDVDLEIGGTDQEFNMLVGRELQKKMNNREKWVLTTPMIVGTDGKTMSKTSGNCIWLDDSPDDMFGKLMGINDELVSTYLELLTDIPLETISALDPQRPVDNKKLLASEITRQFHGPHKAEQAKLEFERVVQGKEAPSSIEQVNLPLQELPALEILSRAFPSESKSNIKRLIEQGGVEIDGLKILAPAQKIHLSGGETLKLGRRKFKKVI